MDFIDCTIIQMIASNVSCTDMAERLSLTQPAISYRLKHIQEEMGDDIFIRNAREVALDSKGWDILPHAKKIVAECNAITDIINSDKGKIGGDILFGCPASFASAYLPQILKGFFKVYPNIKLHVETGTAVNIQEMIENGSMDVVLKRDVNYEKDTDVYDALALNEEPMYLVSSQPITDEYITGKNFIKSPANELLQDQLDAWWHRNYGDQKYNVLVEADSADIVTDLINGDVGWAFMSAIRASKVKGKAYMEVLKGEDGRIISRKSSLLTRRDKRDEDVLSAFTEYITNQIRIIKM